MLVEAAGPRFGPRDVKEVVARHSDAQCAGERRVEGGVDEAFVGRVDVGFRRIGRRVPAVEFGFDQLGREVRAFHQPDLHRHPAPVAPCTCECGEAGERSVAVGEVGLQDNADGLRVERRVGQQCGEDVDGEGELFVFLHVEVHEHAPRCGGVVDGAQVRDHARHGRIESDCACVRRDGRGFDRDVAHGVMFDETHDLVASRCGLRVTEDRFAEHVDVRNDPGGQLVVERAHRRRCRVEHDSGGFFAQPGAHLTHHEGGGTRCGEDRGAQCGAIRKRHAPPRRVRVPCLDQQLGRVGVVGGAQHPVGERDRECFRVRGFEEPPDALRPGPRRPWRGFVRRSQELAGPLDRCVDVGRILRRINPHALAHKPAG